VKVSERPAWRPRVWRRVGVAFAALMVVLVAAGSPHQAGLLVPSLIALAAVGTAVWAVRRSRADRAAYEARLTDWAATEAVLAERLRIARDLHDIVSHGLGLITVRAAAARLATAPAAGIPACQDEQTPTRSPGQHAETTAEPPPETTAKQAKTTARQAETRAAPPGAATALAEAREALAEIETASRAATAELRRMLTVLRTTDESGPRLPVDGLDRLPALVREAAATGLRISLADGPVGEVSQGVQVAICKVVREALHNVARHVGPSDVRIRIYRDGATVVATVKDAGPDGPWPAAPGAGHGLTGLRERVTGLGGIFEAVPVESGFLVTARIPDSAPPPQPADHPTETATPRDRHSPDIAAPRPEHTPNSAPPRPQNALPEPQTASRTAQPGHENIPGTEPLLGRRVPDRAAREGFGRPEPASPPPLQRPAPERAPG
jgi:two-component system sensor histidine kinase DesK